MLLTEVLSKFNEKYEKYNELDNKEVPNLKDNENYSFERTLNNNVNKNDLPKVSYQYDNTLETLDNHTSNYQYDNQIENSKQIKYDYSYDNNIDNQKIKPIDYQYNNTLETKDNNISTYQYDNQIESKDTKIDMYDYENDVVKTDNRQPNDINLDNNFSKEDEINNDYSFDNRYVTPNDYEEASSKLNLDGSVQKSDNLKSDFEIDGFSSTDKIEKLHKNEPIDSEYIVTKQQFDDDLYNESPLRDKLGKPRPLDLYDRAQIQENTLNNKGFDENPVIRHDVSALSNPNWISDYNDHSNTYIGNTDDTYKITKAKTEDPQKVRSDIYGSDNDPFNFEKTYGYIEDAWKKQADRWTKGYNKEEFMQSLSNALDDGLSTASQYGIQLFGKAANIKDQFINDTMNIASNLMPVVTSFGMEEANALKDLALFKTYSALHSAYNKISHWMQPKLELGTSGLTFLGKLKNRAKQAINLTGIGMHAIDSGLALFKLDENTEDGNGSSYDPQISKAYDNPYVQNGPIISPEDNIDNTIYKRPVSPSYEGVNQKNAQYFPLDIGITLFNAPDMSELSSKFLPKEGIQTSSNNLATPLDQYSDDVDLIYSNDVDLIYSKDGIVMLDYLKTNSKLGNGKKALPSIDDNDKPYSISQSYKLLELAQKVTSDIKRRSGVFKGYKSIQDTLSSGLATDFYWDITLSYYSDDWFEWGLPRFPFNGGWFPIKSYDMDGDYLNSTSLRAGDVDIKILTTRAFPKTITINVMEDFYRSIERFGMQYNEAVARCYLDHTYTLSYDKQAFKINLAMMMPNSSVWRQVSYIAIPEFKQQWKGAESKTPKEYPITFSIIGLADYDPDIGFNSTTSSFAYFLTDLIKEQLAQKNHSDEQDEDDISDMNDAERAYYTGIVDEKPNSDSEAKAKEQEALDKLEQRNSDKQLNEGYARQEAKESLAKEKYELSEKEKEQQSLQSEIKQT